ncbi:MAG: hypothetical protein QOJ07_852, partial [Thermoleophilaceae bacterium]|nr:hypothetical protein [Thermoleophilaceae bacterium]
MRTGPGRATVSPMSGMTARARILGPRRADAGLALLLFAAGMVDLFVSTSFDSHDRGRAVPFLVAAALLAAVRRRAPIAVVLAMAVVMAVGQPVAHLLDDTPGALMPYLLTAYTLGAHVEDRRRVLQVGVALSVILCTTIPSTPDTATIGDLLFIPIMAVGAPILAGRLVLAQVRLSAELREKNAQLEEEREERARAAVAEERARIARELHDVVAHSVSVMVVQAGGARRVLDADPGRAAESFTAIETTGREALGEMRRLLGMLRPQDEPAQRAPQPSMDGVEA